MPTRFWLSAHVHLCVSGTHVILLDLKRDCYLALDFVASEGLAAVVPGWPARAALGALSADDGQAVDIGVTSRADVPASVTDAAQSLLARGILTLDQEAGKPASPPALSRPTRDSASMGATGVRLRVRHVLAFVLAITLSVLELRLLPISVVVRRFTDRRTRYLSRAKKGDSAALPASSRLPSLVCAFNRISPYAFASRNACLLRSLTLARYLILLGVPSTWVFGVQDTPFAAHCWLVSGDTVLSDDIDSVSLYTPLLEI